MPRPRIVRQIFLSALAIALAALGAGAWHSAALLRRAYLAELTADLGARAELAAKMISERSEAARGSDFETWTRELGVGASSRITILDRSGTVLGDSMESPERMDNHADRPEFIEAMKGGVGSSVRFSSTLRQRMLYVAVPAGRNETVPAEGSAPHPAVVRVAIPITFIDDALGAIQSRIILGALVIAGLAAAMSYLLARRISRPLEEMRRIADRFAEGDLSARMPETSSEEIAGLAERINQMAMRLEDRIRTVARQNIERETVLSSMAEGVMAVDEDQRLIKLNDSAAALLEIDPVRALGRQLQEVARNAELERLVGQALRTAKPSDGEINLGATSREQCVHVQCTLLKDEGGRDIGVVVVLNDITQMRRLERVRRDFVANVSHELKTPITSIKGFVETLQEGALADPEESKRFLGIIARQSDRLNAIIEDLLSLSRIEQESEEGEIALEDVRVRELLAGSLQLCELKARAKNVRLELTADAELAARLNAPLLEQAVVNLVDNAIKYSEVGGVVEVGADRIGSEVHIRVRDYGCGIPSDHIDRIFERFHRVDKARSRKLGGTGLGLAIVKHIAQAHGGTASVQSAEGKGSLFTLRLPASCGAAARQSGLTIASPDAN